MKECKHSLLEDVEVKEQCCNCGFDKYVNYLDNVDKTATMAVYKLSKPKVSKDAKK